MARLNLTDRFIKSRKPAPPGKRLDFPDAIVPGLALRITDRGHKSFVLIARYPLNPKHPTRRALGEYGALTLDQARDKGRQWLKLIARGTDPRIEEDRHRAQLMRSQATTFGSVADAFLDGPAKKLAKSAEARKIIDREFRRRWAVRPITEITALDVSAAIEAIVKRGAPYQAHNALGYVRRMFNWAIGTQKYGVELSPVERLSAADLIGKRESRERVLSDPELHAVWEAADSGMGYPYGPLIQMLILTGQREREVADSRWKEFDFDKRMWIVPADRMKGGRAHEVPLAPRALVLLDRLPRFTAGDFVFTTTAGMKPVNGFSKAKTRLDRLAGQKSGALAPWVLHDLRRTVRTHLSALPVEDMVRELVIAHAKRGLHKVYDQHSYRDEKRRCLELWEQRLGVILRPAPPGITDLSQARATRQASA